VLSAVSNDTNRVFLHLFENPRLCDRNTVEARDITEERRDRRTRQVIMESESKVGCSKRVRHLADDRHDDKKQGIPGM
jgi:hypothetical protein